MPLALKMSCVCAPGAPLNVLSSAAAKHFAQQADDD